MRSRRLEGVAWRLPAEDDGIGVSPAAAGATHPLDSARPGLATRVAPGDLLVIDGRFGRAFRERAAAESLAALGVAAIVAREFDADFRRIAAGAGLLLLVNGEAATLLAEGDRTRVDVETGLVHDLSTGDWHRPETPLERAPDEARRPGAGDPFALSSARSSDGRENPERAR